VVHLTGDGNADAWASDPTIKANLHGLSFSFLTLRDMWATMLDEVTTTPAVSEIGRLAQLLKAAGLTAPSAAFPPSPPAPGSEAEIAEERENEM
jgi:hypothetical protein